MLLTVNPLELFSSNVDLACAELLVSFRNSKAGGLINTIKGFNCGVRSILRACKTIIQVSVEQINGVTNTNSLLKTHFNPSLKHNYCLKYHYCEQFRSSYNRTQCLT